MADPRVYETAASGTPPPVPASPSTGFPIEGNAVTGTVSTKPGAYWFYQISEEIRNAIIGNGLTPNHLSFTQLRDAVLTRGVGGSRGALVNATTAQSIPTTTFMALAFNAEVYDTDFIHDNAVNNSRLTVPTGITRVRLCGMVDWGTATGGTRNKLITKNGANAIVIGLPWLSRHPGGEPQTILTSAIVPVVSGDYFQLKVHHDATGSISTEAGGQGVWFSMEIIK